MCCKLCILTVGVITDYGIEAENREYVISIILRMRTLIEEVGAHTATCLFHFTLKIFRKDILSCQCTMFFY